MAQMVRQPRIVTKFYIYDPNVGTELGGLVVQHDKDDKGNNKEGTAHVLAVVQQVQWWIDQGLAGDKPVDQISAGQKKVLAQVTRGRSIDNDKDPDRLPRYDKSVQSGSPVFAGQPASSARFKARQAALKGRKGKAAKKPETKPAPPPRPTPAPSR